MATHLKFINPKSKSYFTLKVPFGMKQIIEGLLNCIKGKEMLKYPLFVK